MAPPIGEHRRAPPVLPHAAPTGSRERRETLAQRHGTAVRRPVFDAERSRSSAEAQRRIHALERGP